MLNSRRCCVCDRHDPPLIACQNPQCPNVMCARHTLPFELHDDLGSRVEYFCSRHCYMRIQRRALPVRAELLIAAIVLVVTLTLYLTVVAYFT
ncbi:MAG: hypothetical protein GYB67_09815 [Chloroflexi bacterium]|nr:hypothetical protein [Chloroflexota bacterium]